MDERQLNFDFNHTLRNPVTDRNILQGSPFDARRQENCASPWGKFRQRCGNGLYLRSCFDHLLLTGRVVSQVQRYTGLVKRDLLRRFTQLRKGLTIRDAEQITLRFMNDAELVCPLQPHPSVVKRVICTIHGPKTLCQPPFQIVVVKQQPSAQEITTGFAHCGRLSARDPIPARVGVEWHEVDDPVGG